MHSILDITLLHPKILGFTIALFSTSVLLDWIALYTKNSKFHWAAWVNLAGASVAVVLTIVSGLLAADNVPHTAITHELMETHMWFGFVLGAMIILQLVWRVAADGEYPSEKSWLYQLIGVVGLVAMLGGGYYGGEMVYTHGVAVKAVPVESHEHGEGHEGHDHSDHNAEGETSMKTDQDSLANQSQDNDQKSTSKKVHKHADGTDHVH